MVVDLYKKSGLPEITYYQWLVILLSRKLVEAVKYIINDGINKTNIDPCIKEFEVMITDKHDGQSHEFLYDELLD